ncbi:MAG TPA: LysR family transcriptional regulator, partial [Shewanella frigidimarina]|nr:LysR family transcriptional regulator [Shewanella frigidimarina]
VIAHEAVNQGRLINVLPQHSIGFADISLAYSTKSPQSPVAKAFCEHLL